MGPPSYMQSVVDRNVVTWCMTVCYRVDIQFAVLYRPNSWQLHNIALCIYSSHLCFHPSNHNHDTKETFMCHAVPVSLCALFHPLQHSIRYSNAMKQTASQPDTSMFPTHVIFVSRMFLTPKSIKNFPISTPTQINAWNIAKAAIIIRQIGKKFGVTKFCYVYDVQWVQFTTSYLAGNHIC